MPGHKTIQGYKINYERHLGQGAYGIVWLCKKDSKKFAAKAVNFSPKKPDAYEAMKNGMEELRQLQKYKHHHIVDMHDFMFEDGRLWYILEYCDRGNLSDYYTEVDPDDDATICLMFQCADAVNFMHKPPNIILHRDLKPKNILVKTYQDTVVIKVADFGFSRVVPDAPDIAHTFLFNTERGTAGYMAPEIFHKEKPYGAPVDIFSLGLVYAAMLNHKPGNRVIAPPDGNVCYCTLL